MSQLKKQILFDSFFWIFIKTYEIVFYGSSNDDFTFAIHSALAKFPAELMLYYSGIYLVLPAFFEKRGVRQILITISLTLFFSIVAHRTGRYLLFPKSIMDDSFWKTVFNVPQFLIALFYFLPIPAIGFMIYIFKHLNKIELQRKEAEKQQLIAETNLLKSQVQPHFLFNTLNNLYSLSLQSFEKTSAYILKLSSILEYMLYHANKNFVTLEAELVHIENYVQLEKLRYGDRLEVSWDIDKNLNRIELEPLLLFPFIENAFKHGASKDDADTWITISLKKENKNIIYTVVNSVSVKEKKSEVPGGLGLKNLTNRLQAGYENRFELIHHSTENSYMAILRLSIL